MDLWDPGYMHWAKTRLRTRYELCASGLAPVDFSDLIPAAGDLCATPAGPYGEPELREAIASLRGVTPDRVMPAVGASNANFLALAAVVRPGDKVLIERPVYDPLPRAALLLGLEVLWFDRPPDGANAPDLDAIRRGLAAGAKAVVLTNLHNPSGSLCPESDLHELAHLAEQHGVYVLLDEVYLDYAALNSRARVTRAADLSDRFIVTDSLTKVYGLGPLRAGWIIAAPVVVERLCRVMDMTHVVNPVVSARLAKLAIDRISRLADRCQTAYRQSFPVLEAWLHRQDRIRMADHTGALFAWLRLPDNVSSSRLSDLLVERYDTTLVPGSFFGADDHVRVGFELPPDDLTEALRRVDAAVDDLINA